MENNVAQVSASAIVKANIDGNVIRVNIFDNKKHVGCIELYDIQAKQLYEQVGKALEEFK